MRHACWHEHPVETLERLGKRVHGVHLKDGKCIKMRKKSDKHTTTPGEGDLDLVGASKVLMKLKFRNGNVEYEKNKDNPSSKSVSVRRTYVKL